MPHFSLFGLECGISPDRDQMFKVRNVTYPQRDTPERVESFRILRP